MPPDRSSYVFFTSALNGEMRDSESALRPCAHLVYEESQLNPFNKALWSGVPYAICFCSASDQDCALMTAKTHCF